MLKVIFILLLILDYGYKILKVFLTHEQRKKPLPEAVRDILTPEQHQTLTEYETACQKLRIIQITLRFGWMMVLYGTDLWSRFYLLHSTGSMESECLLIALFILLSNLLDVPFLYIRQFKIDGKFGLNRCRIRTFVTDCIRRFLLSTFCWSLFCIACSYMSAFSSWNHFLLITSSAILAGNLVGPLSTLLFIRMENKSIPLEEGPLRNKLTELFTKEGYRLKQIYVMDASRRTTRANAFCTGVGRLKRIVLYDNLVRNYTEEEILGVFAHELGHYKNRDTVKLMFYSMIRMLLINLLICSSFLLYGQLYASYNLLGLSPAFAVLTVTCSDVMGPVNILLNAAHNALVRPMEIRADALARDYGYGEGLSSFFRRSARQDLVSLHLHPLIMAIEYAHPPIHKRIDAIRTRPPVDCTKKN